MTHRKIIANILYS